MDVKIEVATLARESGADLDQYRFNGFVNKFIAHAKQGLVMGLVCTHPTYTFVNTLYRGLSAQDRYGLRNLPATSAKTAKAETRMMKRCVDMCLKALTSTLSSYTTSLIALRTCSRRRPRTKSCRSSTTQGRIKRYLNTPTSSLAT